MRQGGAKFATVGAPLAVLLIAALLGGCGSGSSSVSSPTAGAPACRGSALRITAERHSSIGSGGTNYTRLFVTNRSPAACTVAGVPKVVAFGRDGKAIEAAEARPDLRPGSKSSRLRVELAPGGSAGFLVSHYDGIGAGRCKISSTSGLRVTIPGAGTRGIVRPPMGYCAKPEAGLVLRVGRIE